MRVRVGNQTAWSAAGPMDPFEYAVSHGFDAFEWFPDLGPDGQGWTESDLPAGARAEIARTAKRHDIALSVHGSWHANPLAAAGRERLGGQAEFAAEIGARVFVTHFVGGANVVEFVDAIHPLAVRLSRDRSLLAVENTIDAAPADINRLFQHVRRRLARDVGLCFDAGHANLCPDTRNDYVGYADRLDTAVPIVHLHLHENWGDRDSHLPVFTGPAARDAAGMEALVARLVRRRFAGCIILEQWPQPPALLDGARERLLRMISSTEVST